MKKHLFTSIFAIVLCICSFGLCGCNNKNYTANQVGSLYTAIKTDNSTKQFFNDDFLTVDFDATKIDLSSNKKGYIFPQVYSVYLASSSGLFSQVLKRVSGNLTYIIKNYNQEQLNNIYQCLQSLQTALKELANNKQVFEITEGNLHYKNVINSYNKVIDCCYKLNNTFASYYFVENIGKVDFSTQELTDANVRDMLRFQLLKTSKVSYNYELKNFVPSNPLGEINTWFNSTQTLKPFVTLAQNTFVVLNNNNDLANHIGTNKAQVKSKFAMLQQQQNSFEQNYNIFIKNLNNFDAKQYFNASNKVAYLQNTTKFQQSYFKVIQNFLTGEYASVIAGLTATISLM